MGVPSKKIYKTNPSIPSFSEIFKKKKIGIVREQPKHENNTPDISSSEMFDNPNRNKPNVPQGRVKLLAKNKKKNVSKAGVIGVDIENPDIKIPQTLEIPTNDQLAGVIDKSTNKRKAIKGLRARTPAKIKKYDKGEKRLHPLGWYESERKKKKEYNIVRNEGKINYDTWRL